MFGWFKKKKEGGTAPAEVAETPLRQGLARTRRSFLDKVNDLFRGRRKIDRDLLDELEEILITADLGVATTRELLESARQLAARDELADGAALKGIFREKIAEYLRAPAAGHELNFPDSGPLVIMVLGVNGVGKTTSIGKLAHKFTQDGRKVLLVAADTFRAAAAEQLQIWGERVGVEVVAREAGADPSSVVFDALDSNRGRESEVIIIDTAGRMHTKVNLVEELKKIKRVMGKKVSGAPHEVILVVDATTGQNAISQARLFNEAVEITGLILTKLDGTAKGGIVVNICRELKIPIRFIGVGEQIGDLRDFEPGEFAQALLEED
ncbi:MAG: signal recognition particle-docking protein FtsY [Desulfobulbaceae bacterium]|nr:signal recognition particle-docking protein FtsY [Desulfobulbaceae bacterium]